MSPKSNEYHFITHWRAEGTIEEVYELISKPLDYPRWWPSVYLKTEQIEPGDEHGLGRRIRLHTKGWLPYTLQWESSVVEAVRPFRLMIRASGDFNGRGIWSLKQDGDVVDITFDWMLTADKPLLRSLSFLLKPVFSANHVWAMGRGQQSLQLELARWHARTHEEQCRIPAPPGPNKVSGYWLALCTIILLGLLVFAASTAFR